MVIFRLTYRHFNTTGEDNWEKTYYFTTYKLALNKVTTKKEYKENWNSITIDYIFTNNNHDDEELWESEYNYYELRKDYKGNIIIEKEL